MVLRNSFPGLMAASNPLVGSNPTYAAVVYCSLHVHTILGKSTMSWYIQKYLLRKAFHCFFFYFPFLIFHRCLLYVLCKKLLWLRFMKIQRMNNNVGTVPRENLNLMKNLEIAEQSRKQRYTCM